LIGLLVSHAGPTPPLDDEELDEEDDDDEVDEPDAPDEPLDPDEPLEPEEPLDPEDEDEDVDDVEDDDELAPPLSGSSCEEGGGSFALWLESAGGVAF
jgi:hypothetical protein